MWVLPTFTLFVVYMSGQRLIKKSYKISTSDWDLSTALYKKTKQNKKRKKERREGRKVFIIFCLFFVCFILCLFVCLFSFFSVVFHTYIFCLSIQRCRFFIKFPDFRKFQKFCTVHQRSGKHILKEIQSISGNSGKF